ncbi:MAG: winged helix DNA-binding protein [Parvibaculum sp.]
MTQRFEMLARAASTAATTERLDPHSSELQPDDRPSWGARQGGPRPAFTFPPTLSPPLQTWQEDQLAQTRHWAKLLLSTYSARSHFFPDGLFSDPVWDMLLDLTHARLHGKQISVSSLCIAGRVPATTALRRIGDLVGAGLVTRIKDPRDGRRVFIELTPEGYDAMVRYLAHMRDAVCKMAEDCKRQG